MDHRTYRKLVKPTEQAKQQARHLRKNLTPPELLLWSVMRDNQIAGLSFRSQHALGVYIADFYCREARLVVEIDGQMHRQGQLIYDQKRDAWMQSCGIHVLRVQARDVFGNLQGVVRSVDSIGKRRIIEIERD